VEEILIRDVSICRISGRNTADTILVSDIILFKLDGNYFPLREFERTNDFKGKLYFAK
jgi:hypothetical protein